MKQSEILATQTNGTDTTPDNTTLVRREQWENSPLTICSIEAETKWFLALGTKRLTEYYPTKKEIIIMLANKSWDLLIQIMVAVTEDTTNFLKMQTPKKGTMGPIEEKYNVEQPQQFNNGL